MTDKKNISQDILDSIGEGVFTVDKNFRITFFNRAAEDITGFKRDEVTGKLCKSVCNSSRCMEACPIGHVLQTKEKIVDHDCTLMHRNGRVLNVKLNSAILYNQDDEPDGGVISFRDMSEFEQIKSRLTKTTNFHGIVAHAKSMHEIFDLIEEIADSDASVLVQGESGTGKEMIANAIQTLSHRKNEPYIKVNCSIFSPQLLASELFGHVKGAFTGAIRDRKGRFEIADRGTIFLDEVAEMSPEMQLQLLRVLQEGTFERVGESVTHKVDVRVIAATNKNLKRALDNGEFREDLYYRLNVIPIEIPPLRSRLDDIPNLVHHFIEKFSMVYNKEIEDIDDNALDLIMRYNWPGNVRELENILEYAFARTSSGEKIQVDKLPPKIRQAATLSSTPGNTKLPGQEEIEILQLLNKHQWNKTKVAKELGVGRTTLWRKMKAMGLEVE
jgi:PAS domain S-box-containing protein